MLYYFTRLHINCDNLLKYLVLLWTNCVICVYLHLFSCTALLLLVLNLIYFLYLCLPILPSGPTSAHLHYPPIFLQAGCPSCRPTNSTEGIHIIYVDNKSWQQLGTAPTWLLILTCQVWRRSFRQSISTRLSFFSHTRTLLNCGEVRIPKPKKNRNWVPEIENRTQSNRSWKIQIKLECGPMPNVMATLPNRGGALWSSCSLANAHY